MRRFCPVVEVPLRRVNLISSQFTNTSITHAHAMQSCISSPSISTLLSFGLSPVRRDFSSTPQEKPLSQAFSPTSNPSLSSSSSSSKKGPQIQHIDLSKVNFEKYEHLGDAGVSFKGMSNVRKGVASVIIVVALTYFYFSYEAVKQSYNYLSQTSLDDNPIHGNRMKVQEIKGNAAVAKGDQLKQQEQQQRQQQ